MTRLLDTWDTFWFSPTSAAPVALFRIAVGVLTLFWTLTLLPNLFTFHSDSGAFPNPFDRDWSHGLFDLADADALLLIAAAVLLVASVCLVLGWHSRLMSVVVWGLALSFLRHNRDIGNAGDRVIVALTFFLMLAPSGLVASLDSRRRRASTPNAPRFPRAAPWALRLAQIQVSLIYFFTVWEKVQRDAWTDGTAVYYAWNFGDVVRFRLPSFIVDNEILVNLATWGTLAVELSLALLVWTARYRLLALALGVALHVSVELTMTVGFFGPAMLVSYLAFMPPDAAERTIERSRRIRSAILERWRPAGRDELVCHGGAGSDVNADTDLVSPRADDAERSEPTKRSGPASTAGRPASSTTS